MTIKNNLSWTTFELIQPVFSTLMNIKKLSGFNVEIESGFRKYEYVFGVTIHYKEGNRKYSNYLNLMFSHALVAEDYVISEDDIKEFFDNFREIIEDINSIYNTSFNPEKTEFC